MKHISLIGKRRATSSQKTFKAIALLLVFCIADVYVIAGNRVTRSDVARDIATKPNTSAKDTATNISANKMLLGRLVVPYHRQILVNGQSAMSGDIILSNSRLRTLNTTDPARVEIGSIAMLDIEPNTDLSLTFDQRSVEVKVAVGNATLSTSDGVKGRVIMPDGEVNASMPSPDPQCKRPPYKRPEIIVPVFVLVFGILVLVLVNVDRQNCTAVASPVIPCEVVP